MTSIDFNANILRVDGKRIDLSYPIADAFVIDRTVIVMFPYDAAPLDEDFHNVIGMDLSGRKIWEAELPSGTIVKSDAYVPPVHSRNPLQFVSWSSLICTLDPRTGKIIRTEFTK